MSCCKHERADANWSHGGRVVRVTTGRVHGTSLLVGVEQFSTRIDATIWTPVDCPCGFSAAEELRVLVSDLSRQYPAANHAEIARLAGVSPARVRDVLAALAQGWDATGSPVG